MNMLHGVWLILWSSLLLVLQQPTLSFSFSHPRKWTQDDSLLKCFSSPSNQRVDDANNNPIKAPKKVKGANKQSTEPETLDIIEEDTEEINGASNKAKAKKNAKQKKKARRKTNKKDEIPHWLDDSDCLQIEYGNSNSTQGVSLLRFKIRGNPRPLRRHRTSFGRMYNPSEGLQNSFRDNVRQLIFSDGKLTEPLFDGDEALVMTIIFRLKRPKKDFVGGKPGPDRMRPTAPSQIAQTRTDVDNLVKFVFDSMNMILYEDDRQISSVHVIKVLDNEGMCQGSTEILLQSVTEEDVSVLMKNSFAIANGGGSI